MSGINLNAKFTNGYVIVLKSVQKLLEQKKNQNFFYHHIQKIIKLINFFYEI